MTYWGLGLILNRSRWQRQDIWLILLFLFCPLLMPCQLLSNIGCCIRNALRGAATSDGFAYYFSVAIGMHESKSIGQHSVHGSLRIMDHRRPWFILTHMPWNLPRLYQIVALLFPLAQGLGTTIIYVHRMSMPGADGATLLGIDHRNGWMAFGGTLAAFVSLLVLLVGYDWKGDYSRDWRITIMGVQTYDTSNAFIWEGFLAFFVQQVRFLAYLLHVYNRHHYRCSLLSLTDSGATLYNPSPIPDLCSARTR